MYLLLCVESFNYFCSKPKPAACNWDQCVYNAANGGMLARAGDFFTDDAGAGAHFRQRLRYLAARYGHSTHVLGWEFFNEVGGGGAATRHVVS